MKRGMAWAGAVLALLMNVAGTGAEPARIRVTGATARWFSNRFFQFTRPVSVIGGGSVSLDLVGTVDPEHAGRLATIRELVALDDCGGLATSLGAQIHETQGTWTAQAHFTEPTGHSRKWEWVEGTLCVWRNVEPFSVDFPVPPRSEHMMERRGAAEIELVSYREGGPGEGPSVQCRIASPPETMLSSKGDRGINPVLVGASGTTYTPISSGGGMEIGGLGVIARPICRWKAPGEKIVAVRIEAILKTDAVPLTTFRVENVRLVSPATKPAVRKPIGRYPAPASYADQHGGELSASVVLPASIEPSGVLQIGLARVDGREAAALRWTNIEVKAKEPARIGPLREGDYRVVLAYRPDPGSPLPAGRWQNGEQRIRIKNGEAVKLLPLTWVPSRR